jgi:arylsulfatase A-like enzyme
MAGRCSRREVMTWTAALIAGAILPPAFYKEAWAAPPEVDRPNIILCMTDDQGWGDVSYNGLRSVATPNLDEMASNGLRFNRFYAASPICSPTRGSVMTGRHPSRFGCFNWGYPLREREVALPAVLREAGYATGHFGKWHLQHDVAKGGNPVSPADPMHPGKAGFDTWVSSTNFFEHDPRLSRNGAAEQFSGDGSDVIVGEALKFIESSARARKPFLAVVWFGNPHLPHQPIAAELEAAGGDAYYGEILGIDRAMGRLRKRLRELNLADNTLLWFNSDNGPRGGGSTGGLRGAKGNIFEGGIRVPGLVEWPARITSGQSTDMPASTSDIFPTVCAAAGLTGPPPVQPLDGISLLPLFEGNMPQRPQPIGFWHTPGARDAVPGLEDGASAWMRGPHKLFRERKRSQLYDLNADPAESADLAAREPRLTAALEEELTQWKRSVLRSLAGQDYR